VAPTAYSLLSDYFHPNKRALVFAFFSITIYLGELVRTSVALGLHLARACGQASAASL
jgi:hypothetical protein